MLSPGLWNTHGRTRTLAKADIWPLCRDMDLEFILPVGIEWQTGGEREGRLGHAHLAVTSDQCAAQP